MSDKIIVVEFDKKELKANCKMNCPVYKNCKRTDRNLIKCQLIIKLNYKILEAKK